MLIAVFLYQEYPSFPTVNAREGDREFNALPAIYGF